MNSPHKKHYFSFQTLPDLPTESSEIPNDKLVSNPTRPVSALSYLTNREVTNFTNQHILQQIHSTQSLFITKPKKMPCYGMTFSDFENLKLKLAQSGIKVDRSAIMNGLSTPYPTLLQASSASPNGDNDNTSANQHESNNQQLLSRNRNKYPFPIPGETLVPLAKHGLTNPNIGSGKSSKKGGKGKKGKKKGKGKKKK